MNMQQICPTKDLTYYKCTRHAFGFMITNVATYQCILFQIIKTLENFKFCYEEIEQN